MRVAVVYAGYGGPVTAACLADFGHEVVCVDRDATRIDQRRIGRSPIDEVGPDALLERNLASHRLDFSTCTAVAVETADVVFLAVGAPARRGGGHADLADIDAAAAELAEAAADDTVLVTTPTAPVGTADVIEAIIVKTRSEIRMHIASNPDFLRERAAIEDFRRPDRIVVGTEEPAAQAAMRKFYAPICTEPPLMFTGRRAVEPAGAVPASIDI